MPSTPRWYQDCVRSRRNTFFTPSDDTVLKNSNTGTGPSRPRSPLNTINSTSESGSRSSAMPAFVFSRSRSNSAEWPSRSSAGVLNSVHGVSKRWHISGDHVVVFIGRFLEVLERRLCPRIADRFPELLFRGHFRLGLGPVVVYPE